MKSILLASVASVAFAGVAAAEVTFSGSATLGYNSTNATSSGATTDNNLGFYGDLGLSVNFTQELDNGLTVSASADVADLNADLFDVSYELSLTSDNAGLYVGDTALAADKMWSAPDGMDEGFDGDAVGGNPVLRGEVTMAGVTAGVSYSIDGGDLVGLQVAANGSFGSVDVGMAYQDANGDSGESVFGVSAGMTFGAADVSLAYAKNNTTTDSSTAIGVSYPAGPVTLGAYYAMNTGGNAYGLSADYANGPFAVSVGYDVDTAAVATWALDGSYDVGNGIAATFGTNNESDFYVGGTYDLGGGASLLVSYATDANGSQDDEIGANDYQAGTTVEVSFAF